MRRVSEILAVHDRPCRECIHASKVSGGWICRKHLMAITPDMLVTYKPAMDADHGGLCFVANPQPPGDE